MLALLSLKHAGFAWGGPLNWFGAGMSSADPVEDGRGGRHLEGGSLGRHGGNGSIMRAT